VVGLGGGRAGAVVRPCLAVRAPRVGPGGGEQHVARGREQPRELAPGRHVVGTAPGDRERLGGDVGSGLQTDATGGVREHGPVVLLEQPGQPGVGILVTAGRRARHAAPWGSYGPSTPLMSAERAGVTG